MERNTNVLNNNKNVDIELMIERNEPLSVIAKYSGFKKKIVFGNKATISYLSNEDTVVQYINIIFRDNGKVGSDQNAIQNLIEITKFTKIMSQILVNSPKFTEFVNGFFIEYQNNPHFPLLCGILKEIILKICDEQAEIFLQNITNFLNEMPNYTDVFAIKELFLTLVNYHADIYPFTEQINDLLVNKFARSGSLFVYVEMAEKVVSVASSPRRFSRQTLDAFNPETFVRIVCETESPVVKVSALNVLEKLNLSEEKKAEIIPRLLRSLTNTVGIVQAKIIEFTKTVPANYISIVTSPQTHCAVKQQIISNACAIRNVSEEDIALLAERMNAPENKTNPFIADLLEIFLQRSELQGAEWSALREQIAERKNKRTQKYGELNQMSVSRSIQVQLPNRRASGVGSSTKKEDQIPGLYRFNSNTWTCFE